MIPITYWACGHIAQGVCLDFPTDPYAIRTTLPISLTNECNYCEGHRPAEALAPIFRWACGHVGQASAVQFPPNPSSIELSHRCSFCAKEEQIPAPPSFENEFPAIEQHVSEVVTGLFGAKYEEASSVVPAPSSEIDDALVESILEASQHVLLAGFRLPPTRDVSVYSEAEMEDLAEIDYETEENHLSSQKTVESDDEEEVPKL